MKSFGQCKTALVANGCVADASWLAHRLKTIDWLVAVDAGLNHLFRIGRTPNLIIGDFDSVEPSIAARYPSVERIKLLHDKDETDLAIALQRVMQEREQALVFAALGLRTDHLLANLQLLTRYPGRVIFEAENERLFALKEACTISCMPGQVISLFPMGSPALGVTSQGLKWELVNATLSQELFSISNVCLGDTFTVKVAQGCVICCMNR